MSSITEMDVDDMDFPLPTEPSPPIGARIGQSLGNMQVVNDASRFKRWVCLYPLYFDSALSVGKGRKVPAKLAVPSPHARQISEAVKQCGLNVCLEPAKTHPRDFFRPGRVRVQLFMDGVVPVRSDIATRKQLMQRVAELLPSINMPRDKEPSLEDLIAQGALPSLPGMVPGMMDDASIDEPVPQPSTSVSKPKKATKPKKKGRAKTIV
ncbi:signal recognition particle subunit [Coemansia sp. RSA 1822]|nr:signal recognition particle subunit [Coemansia sp. RSA 638]KAJ2122084.1 signal recognition particle subunit [Coemansia sp. RSA 720]KAJ2562622.1 signal recognition particle subunit [Coemansia sp. RSA 1822]